MSKYTEKSKEYTMAYMKEKLDEIKFRVPKGQKDLYRQHAEKMGEKMTPFIIRAIGEAMARDNDAFPAGMPTEAAQTLTEAKRMVRAAGDVILPSLLRESVAEASRATGETGDAFLWRAVSAQAEQDKEKRKAAVNAADAPQGILIPLVVSLSLDELERAEKAAEAAGEGVTDFIRRVIKTQAARKPKGRKSE